MKLARAERTLIEPAKVRDYLLSREHPIGQFKAVSFESLGYSADASALRALAAGRLEIEIGAASGDEEASAVDVGGGEALGPRERSLLLPSGAASGPVVITLR